MGSWIAFICGLMTAALAGWLLVRYIKRVHTRQLADEVRMARRESEVKLKDLENKLQLEYDRRQAELERERQTLRAECRQKEEEALSTLISAEREKETLERRREALDEQLQSAAEREDFARVRAESYREKIAEVAKISAEEAREAVLEEARQSCADEILDMKELLLRRSEREIQEEARRTLVACMQRLASRPQHDITATIVKLPGEEMKGRIIGREGRNIKSFESVTGTTLLIDETPGSVLISSFDPVRREVARIALEALMRDGRIHPASIEEAAAEAEIEVKQSVIEFGEEAVRRLRISKVHPEVVGMLGRMHYRLANNQNALEHSIEVAHLCALLAAEVGLEPETAKRCGLFHDIGKVLDEEYGGSHAMAGANFIKRYGSERPEVINAVAAHHEEIPAESAYVPLLMTADSLSAMRPGARAESIDSYIQRVRSLEEIARSYKGVQDAYAIQAGREVRVIVESSKVDDSGARKIATQIRRKIENELQYPGTIKVTVIRERRVSETAK